ncbi:MAG: 60, gp60 [Candidatus Sulfotelmatobacter sp.]|nr:60, gp60 [Candidatus Sulfotelmatobacter sp.]
MAKRIQRKRTKGWKMPPNTVYVGRPTKWGNPFPVGRLLCRESAIVLFEALFGIEPSEPLDNREKFFQHRGNGYPVGDVAGELRGKNLACWCPLDQLCHADVLLEIANQLEKS